MVMEVIYATILFAGRNHYVSFLSGIAFALGGKITPVSAKTYFITPQNVDVLGAQAEQPESSGHYF